MATTSRTAQLSASMAPLQTGKNAKKASAPVADSWEDESLSDSGGEGEGKGDYEDIEATPSSSSNRPRMPDPPPPTPISPTTNNSGASRMAAWMSSGPTMATTTLPAGSAAGAGAHENDNDDGGARKRPEKTDAVARRMIAGALGLKAPKMTEEQRAYDKAIKEKEKARREKEREEERRRKEQAERAKAAVWED